MSKTSSESFQLMLMRIHNSRVREWFKDITDRQLAEIEANQSAVFPPRAILLKMCTIVDNDSNIIMIQKILLFEMSIGHFKSELGNFYGYPIDVYQEKVGVYKPQVKLFFKQDEKAVPEGETPLEAEISFRLTNETSASMTETKAKTLAKKIRDTLLVSNGYVFDKGKFLCRYTDPENGYNFQIYALSKPEGQQVIRKILEIRDHPYNDDYFACTDPGKESISRRTGTSTVYGKSAKKRRWRPTGKVRFQWATLSVYGKEKDIYLCDRSGTRYDSFYVR